ncbi:MAG: hypothetical protein KGD60_00560, partial [Candidatus Thorarchaeota archaeon]|nr:hypothetical protein [Candidatus Thorarchaeota archaeon]
AQAHGTPVVYRCSIPYWELGLDRLKPILSQVDTLLISNQSWRYLKKLFKPNPVKIIRSVTDARFIIREASDKYRFVVGDEVQFAECNSDTDDITEWFVAGLMHKIADGSNILQALHHAVKFEESRLATG